MKKMEYNFYVGKKGKNNKEQKINKVQKYKNLLL